MNTLTASMTRVMLFLPKHCATPSSKLRSLPRELGQVTEYPVTVSCGAPLVECPADFDEDGEVSAADLAVLLAGWGPCAACLPDLDGSGFVEAADLAELLAAWGPVNNLSVQS